MNKKEKQYQAALDATFNPAGYLINNMTPAKIEARILTAVEIAIGDGGFRAKEILENWQQLMEMDDKTYFKQVKFYEYTKIYKRALNYALGKYPKNYHLTYSLNEDNKPQALDILKRGGNISAVFRDKKLPKRFLNHKVFNGDKSDLRFNDPKNVIIGLYAKGRALKDKTGFVQDV